MAFEYKADARNYRMRVRFPNGQELPLGMTLVNFTGTVEEAKAHYISQHKNEEVLEIEEVAPPNQEEVAAIVQSPQKDLKQNAPVPTPPMPAAIREAAADHQRQPSPPPAR